MKKDMGLLTTIVVGTFVTGFMGGSFTSRMIWHQNVEPTTNVLGCGEWRKASKVESMTQPGVSYYSSSYSPSDFYLTAKKLSVKKNDPVVVEETSELVETYTVECEHRSKIERITK